MKRDWLKQFHAIWWALWMDFGQPKGMVKLLEWFVEKRKEYI